MPTTINELRVEVTKNTLGKMQYFPLFDHIDIVLDQCPCKNKLIQGSLTTHSNIYKATSVLFLSFFKFKVLTEDLKIKTMKEGGGGGGWRGCNPHGQHIFGRIAY